MTKNEYEELQNRFSKKLKKCSTYCTNRESEYNDAILTCKSILKDIYQKNSAFENMKDKSNFEKCND